MANRIKNLDQHQAARCEKVNVLFLLLRKWMCVSDEQQQRHRNNHLPSSFRSKSFNQSDRKCKRTKSQFKGRVV